MPAGFGDRDRSPRREKDITSPTGTMPAPFSGSAKQSGFVKLEGGKGDDQLHQVVTKTKKCDPLKQGLEELQRILPHLGSPEEEKVIFVMFDRDCPSYKN